MTNSTLLLDRSEVLALLTLEECMEAVERGFRLLGSGEIPPPAILGLHAPSGGLHIKAAHLPGKTGYFVAKANTNFPTNPARHQLPTIQGTILICSADDGRVLALIDSIEITIKRTAAASAVAAKYLARAASRVLTVCGCGNQGLNHLRSLLRILPIEKVYAYDLDSSAAEHLVRVAQGLGTAAQSAQDLSAAVRRSDVCVTCTPATRFFLQAADVRPGTFIAAVGADNEGKQEIDPALFKTSTVVVDSLAQCQNIGDLHHAVRAGVVTAEEAHAELAAVVAGKTPGRTRDDEVTIFDSTGIAVEDAVSALLVYEKAAKAGAGRHFAFSS